MSPVRGWAPVFVLPSLVLLCTPQTTPRWLFMWLLSIAIYAGCKWLTWRRSFTIGVSWQRHLGYLLAWPGLNAPEFLSTEPLAPGECPTSREWAFAWLKLCYGAAIFWLGQYLVPPGQTILLGWVGMVGLAFLLHFGLFHVLSCAWRVGGVHARPLMHNPLAARSVSEFWSQRWNLAFRDLAHRFLFRPLTEKLGSAWGIVAGFLFSGLVHDLVISLPAGGGYGGPTIYFAIQAVALLTERSRFGKALGLRRGWRGWLFTAVVVTGPAYWLFHPTFLERITVPFMQAVGAANAH